MLNWHFVSLFHFESSQLKTFRNKYVLKVFHTASQQFTTYTNFLVEKYYERKMLSGFKIRYRLAILIKLSRLKRSR